jgi:hypothetical protein
LRRLFLCGWLTPGRRHAISAHVVCLLIFNKKMSQKIDQKTEISLQGWVISENSSEDSFLKFNKQTTCKKKAGAFSLSVFSLADLY